MQFSEVVRSRVSTREFAPTPVSDDAVKVILEAALYAPVGMHAFDTLHLTVITDRKVLSAIHSCSAKASGQDEDPIHGAPLLIVVSSSQTGDIAGLNVSCLIENMLLAATDLGLGNLYVRGAIAEAAKDGELLRAMQIPAGFVPMASVAVGHAVQPSSPRSVPKNDVTKVDFIA